MEQASPARAAVPEPAPPIPYVPAGPPPQLGPSSRVDLLQARSKELRQPYYGDKATLWSRLCVAEAAEAEKAANERYMDARRQELVESFNPTVPQPVPSVAEPTQVERDLHNLTHLPRKPWCEVCCMASPDDEPRTRRGFFEKDRSPPLLFGLHVRQDVQRGGAGTRRA